MTLSAPNAARNGICLSVLSIRQPSSRLWQKTTGVARTACWYVSDSDGVLQASLQARGSWASSPRILATRGIAFSHPTPDTRAAAFELRAAPLAQISTRKQLRTYANLVTSVKLLDASANLVLEWGASSVGWPPPWLHVIPDACGRPWVYHLVACPPESCSYRCLHIALSLASGGIPFFHSFDSLHTPFEIKSLQSL